MNGGGGHGRMADRDAELVQVRYHIACRIQLFDVRLLMSVDFQAADIVTCCPQLEGHF